MSGQTNGLREPERLQKLLRRKLLDRKSKTTGKIHRQNATAENVTTDQHLKRRLPRIEFADIEIPDYARL